MAYQVIKTIKGKRYLYNQSTYRDGGKVKTISEYIGVADETADKTRQALLKQIEQAPEPESEELTLQIPVINLNGTIKISLNALKSQFKKTAHQLEKYGVSPQKFPEITLKHGKEYRHYKPAFKQKLTVTVPKKYGREKLRKEYRTALHRGFIETLEQEVPEKIAPFKYAFDKAYRDTQNALTHYLMNCNSRGSFARVLALKFFSVINPIPTGKRQHLAPHKLGLIDYGKRENWKADYSQLMAEIDKKGIGELYQQAQKEIATANHRQRATIKKKTIFFIRRRKTIKRLQARIEANKSLLRKLDLIRKLNL